MNSTRRGRRTLPVAGEGASRDELEAWAGAIIESKIGGAVPLPLGSKTPTPTGFQGAKNDFSKCRSISTVRRVIARGFKAHDPDTRELTHYAVGGLAIRFRDGVIGIDIDAYGSKRGAEKLAELEAQWGRLPRTYYLTSRGPGGPSRILLFRATPGRTYGNPGGDIEILQPGHRYGIAPPSVHPEGRPYVLYGPDDEVLLAEEMPSLEDLAELPAAWDNGLEGLHRQAGNGQLSVPALDWLREHGQYESCAQTEATLRSWLMKFRDGPSEAGWSVHNTGRDAAWAIIGDCADGHDGAWAALKELKTAFFRAGKDKGKDERGLTEDWHRFVAGAIEDQGKDGERPGDSCTPKKTDDGGRLEFTPATAVREEPVEWVWEGRIPLGILALSAGAGGSAKSVHACWLAAGITRGTVPGAWKGQPRRVIWATIEASHGKEVKPRLMAAGADLSLIDFVTVRASSGDRADDHIRIFDPVFLEQMRSKVAKDGVGLIVLDPALDVIDRINTRDQQEVRTAVGRINAFAEEMNILVLGIAHFNKMTTVDSAIDRITGSAAFSQRIRAAIAFAYNAEDDRFVISQVKNNWGEVHTLANLSFALDVVAVGARRLGITAVRLRWEDESVFSVDDLLGKRHTAASGSPVQDKADRWLETKLASGPALKEEVMHETKIAGISEAAIKRSFRNLDVVSESAQVSGDEGSRRGRRPAMWRLPEAKIQIGGTPL